MSLSPWQGGIDEVNSRESLLVSLSPWQGGIDEVNSRDCSTDRRSQIAGVTFYILCLHNVDNYLLQSRNKQEMLLFLIVLERKKFDFVLFFQNKQ